MHTTSTPTSAKAAARRQLATSLILDALVLIVVLIPVIVCEYGIEPFRRGFFCNDESIRYPFHSNTVTTVSLGLLVGLLPAGIFFIVEYVRVRQNDNFESYNLLGAKMPLWLMEWFRQFAFFCFGMALVFDVTEVGKYTLGRLRPHFMEVCQPQISDGSTCADAQNQNRYIENYVCASGVYTVEDVRQARLSFPSGHSSLSFYAMVYVAIYLHHRIRWHGPKLARHFLQFLLIVLAWFTALSRVMDNWHHWSDVLVGSLLGVIGALITTRYIAKLSKHANVSMQLNRMNVSIPRQDTQTTLDDIIATPPPYNNTLERFNDLQYCSTSKV